jgi:hypothetical protein
MALKPMVLGLHRLCLSPSPLIRLEHRQYCNPVPDLNRYFIIQICPSPSIWKTLSTIAFPHVKTSRQIWWKNRSWMPQRTLLLGRASLILLNRRLDPNHSVLKKFQRPRILEQEQRKVPLLTLFQKRRPCVRACWPSKSLPSLCACESSP